MGEYEERGLEIGDGVGEGVSLNQKKWHQGVGSDLSLVALPADSSGYFSERTAHSCTLLSQGTGGLIDGALESGVGMKSKRPPIPSLGVLKRRESLLVPVLPL